MLCAPNEMFPELNDERANAKSWSSHPPRRGQGKLPHGDDGVDVPQTALGPHARWGVDRRVLDHRRDDRDPGHAKKYRDRTGPVGGAFVRHSEAPGNLCRRTRELGKVLAPQGRDLSASPGT